jgi:hypothetical protein
MSAVYAHFAYIVFLTIADKDVIAISWDLTCHVNGSL